MADPSFGRVGIYIRESSRSLSERATEHFNDAESFSKKSHIIKHWINSHPDLDTSQPFLTVKPVGAHFRLPGHDHSDMIALPIEKIRTRCRFVMEARERFCIKNYNSVKLLTVKEIESGLNLK